MMITDSAGFGVMPPRVVDRGSATSESIASATFAAGHTFTDTNLLATSGQLREFRAYLEGSYCQEHDALTVNTITTTRGADHDRWCPGGAKLGDSVTTDHISPAGSIKADSPACTYLADHRVARKDFAP